MAHRAKNGRRKISLFPALHDVIRKTIRAEKEKWSITNEKRVQVINAGRGKLSGIV